MDWAGRLGLRSAKKIFGPNQRVVPGLPGLPAGSATVPLYGLPPGVFPSTVTAFSLANNGSISVDLAGPCYVHFEYLTYFAPRVTGVLRYGSLSDLQGVQVRRFLIWLNVIRIKVDLPPPPRYVYLDIGWITRRLPASDFQSVHSCEESNRCRLSSALAVAAKWLQVGTLALLPGCFCDLAAICVQSFPCSSLLEFLWR